MRRCLSIVGAVGVMAACAACGSSGALRVYQQLSPAMEPTLKVGQRVAVSLDRRYVPKVGDIVALHPPSGAVSPTPMCGNSSQGAGHPQVCDAPTSGKSGMTFIKRVVAGPGDRIKMIGGRVYRNGTPEAESGYTLACGGGPSCNFPMAATVPLGYYLVLGDNRGASDDSRFWGPVPRAWIIGKVVER